MLHVRTIQKSRKIDMLCILSLRLLRIERSQMISGFSLNELSLMISGFRHDRDQTES